VEEDSVEAMDPRFSPAMLGTKGDGLSIICNTAPVTGVSVEGALLDDVVEEGGDTKPLSPLISVTVRLVLSFPISFIISSIFSPKTILFLNKFVHSSINPNYFA
jgi:hypothetical protein